jgi:hypothetical protein
MVEQPARGRDQDVDAAGDLGVLVAERDPADQERDREAVVDAVALEALLHLGGELAGRLEDERARHARPGPAGLEQRQHGQHEGGRLAGSGLRDAENVLAGEDVRDGLGLDRRRLGIAGRRDRLKDFVAETEFGEGHEAVGPWRAGCRW